MFNKRYDLMFRNNEPLKNGYWLITSISKKYFLFKRSSKIEEIHTQDLTSGRPKFNGKKTK